MEEIWKAVDGHDGVYEVSNMGRVKSLANGARRKEKIVKAFIISTGYLRIVLCQGGKLKRRKVHQLVAIAFLNHKPDGYNLVVDHINGIKTDNRAENLRIVTQRFNLTFGERSDRSLLSSQYPGVRWHKERGIWQSHIVIGGKQKYLGCFTNELDASVAYQNELLKL